MCLGLEGCAFVLLIKVTRFAWFCSAWENPRDRVERGSGGEFCSWWTASESLWCHRMSFDIYISVDRHCHFVVIFVSTERV